MASVLTAFRTRLLTYSGISTLLGQRIYPDVLKKDATLPAMIIYRISTARDHTISDVTRAAHSRIECRCYGSTRIQADSIADAIRTSGICSYRGTVDGIYFMGIEIDSGEENEHEPPTDGNQVHRYLTVFDFLVHYWEAS